jgi:hypothetical protein
VTNAALMRPNIISTESKRSGPIAQSRIGAHVPSDAASHPPTTPIGQYKSNQ